MARKSIAPWSERVSEGLIDQPIDSQISSTVDLRPTVDTGFIDLNGTWKGNQASDTEFGFYHKGTSVLNGGVELCSTCDMTGFTDFQIAIKTTVGGNCKIEAVMGPDTNKYAGLSPVNAATVLKGTSNSGDFQMGQILVDSAESITNDVWNIFSIQGRLKDQKLLQFKITNNTGGTSDIEVMYLRLV